MKETAVQELGTFSQSADSKLLGSLWVAQSFS